MPQSLRNAMGQSGALTAADFGFQGTSHPHSPQGSQGTTSSWSEHVEEPFKPGNGDLTQEALYDFIATGADPSQLKDDDFWVESAKACQVKDMDLLDEVDGHSAVLAVSAFLGESPKTVRSVVQRRLDLYNEHSKSRAREYFDSKMAKELNVPTEPWMSMMRKLLEGPDETWTAETYKARDETILSAAQACGSMLGNDIRVHKAIHTVLNSECSPIIKSYMGDWAYHRVRHSDTVDWLKHTSRRMGAILPAFPVSESEDRSVQKWLDGIDAKGTKSYPLPIDDVWSRVDGGDWPPEEDWPLEEECMTLAGLFPPEDAVEQ